MNGDFANITDWDVTLPTSPLVQLLTNKLNATPCAAGSASSGIPQACKHTIGVNNSPSDFIDLVSARYILPSGAQFWIWHPFSSCPNWLIFTIETKQSDNTSPHWGVGSNYIIWVCNLSEQRNFTWNSSMHSIAPGHCGPWNGSQPAYDALFN